MFNSNDDFLENSGDWCQCVYWSMTICSSASVWRRRQCQNVDFHREICESVQVNTD